MIDARGQPYGTHVCQAEPANKVYADGRYTSLRVQLAHIRSVRANLFSLLSGNIISASLTAAQKPSVASAVEVAVSGSAAPILNQQV